MDDDDVPVVIAPSTAAHLRSLADVLLRNGESGAFKAYVEVNLPDMSAIGSSLHHRESNLRICVLL